MCPSCEMVWPMRVTASLPGLWNRPSMNLHEWPEPQQPPHPLQQRLPPLGLSALNEQADCDVLLGVPKMARNEYGSLAPGREENCSAAGAVARKPIGPTPPPFLRDYLVLGVAYLPCQGGGQPQHLRLKMIPTSRGSF